MPRGRWSARLYFAYRTFYAQSLMAVFGAMRNCITLVTILAVGLTSTAVIAQDLAQSPTPPPAAQGTELDLAKPFHTHSAWRFVVTEGPPVKDDGDNDAPGALSLCLHKGSGGTCISEPVTIPLWTTTPRAGLGNLHRGISGFSA